MSFQTQRIAFVYIQFKPGPFDEYARQIVKLVREKIGPQNSVEAFLVLGGADLLLRIDLSDFRKIRRLQSYLQIGTVLRSSWIFGSPYANFPQDPRFNPYFLLHFRLNRQIYAENGSIVDDVVLDAVRKQLRNFEGKIWGRLIGGVGWPDYLVEGSFECSQKDLLDFVLSIRSMNVAAEEERYFLVQRAITTIAIRCDRRFQPIPPKKEMEILSFIRSSPGQFQDVVSRLESTAEVTEGVKLKSIRAVDGTYDIQALFEAGPEKAISFLDNATHGVTSEDSGLQRSRSHLLIASPEDVEIDLGRCQVDGLRIPSRRFPSQLEEIEALGKHLAKVADPEPEIPEHRTIRLSLEGFLQHVLHFFQISEDSRSGHVDAFPAIQASLSSLDLILNRIQVADQALLSSEGWLRDHFERELENLRDTLARWRAGTARLMNERSAGNFGALFDRNNPLFSFVGGCQKPLLTADCLLAEFFAEIPTSLTGGTKGSAWRFATVFEPSDAIGSYPLLGIVYIPIKYRFSLDRVLPSLWHEVGQYVFELAHPDNRREIANLAIERITTLRNLSKGDYSTGLEGSTEAQVILRGLDSQILERRDLRLMVSDIFADFIVFNYGFRRDFDAFARDLAILKIEMLLSHRTTNELRIKQMSDLVVRLFIVHQLHYFQGGDSELADLFDFLEHNDRWVTLVCWEMLAKIRDIALADKYDEAPFLRSLFTRTSPQKDASGCIAIETCMPNFLEVANKAADDLSSKTFRIMVRPFLERIFSAAKNEGHMEDAGVNTSGTTFRNLRDGFSQNLANERLANFYFYLYRKDLENFLAKKQPSAELMKFRAALSRSAVMAFYQRIYSTTSG